MIKMGVPFQKLAQQWNWESDGLVADWRGEADGRAVTAGGRQSVGLCGCHMWLVGK